MITGDEIFGTADIVETEIRDGEVRAKIGDAAKGLGYAAGLPMYGPDGFVGRPNQPDENGDACQALYIIDGEGKISVGTRDNRYADKVGELDPGDRAIVTSGEARFLIKRVDDAVFIISKNQSTGKTMIWEMNGSTGVMQTFNDRTWIEQTGSSITLGAGDGSATTTLLVNAAGVQINGANFLCATAGGHLGMLVPPAAGFPGASPIAPANSILSGPTGPAGVPSPSWTVSPS